jgi:hypothetical protein
MKIPPRQIVAKQRISKITEGVYEAINKVCKEDGFEVTYAEINSALINKFIVCKKSTNLINNE